MDRTGAVTQTLRVRSPGHPSYHARSLPRPRGRITASVKGRAGTFDLQHCAQMGGPDPRTYWLVVPGSGTGELRGITGEARYQHDESGAKFTLDYDFIDQA